MHKFAGGAVPKGWSRQIAPFVQNSQKGKIYKDKGRGVRGNRRFPGFVQDHCFGCGMIALLY